MASITELLQTQGFGLPSGPLGRIGAALMAHGNAETERRLVQLAAIADTETVLVLGPGPGIGLAAAGEQAALTIGVEPSELMRARCERRCAELVAAGRVRVVAGDAEHTGQDDASVDVLFSVNNVMLWPDREAGLAEAFRVLRPGGRLLISAHQRWLPGGLAEAVRATGFVDVQSWTWEPPNSRFASLAAQLRAVRP
jgi:SAM-dependent methyltransferase